MDTREIEQIINGKSEKSTTGQVWSITKFISSVLWGSTKFVVKNTPAAIGMAWEVKKQISDEVIKKMNEEEKEQKQLELENKILQLKTRRGEKR